MTKRIIADPHWEACKTCTNDDADYGCVIKEEIPLFLREGFIVCGDYQEKKCLNQEDTE